MCFADWISSEMRHSDDLPRRLLVIKEIKDTEYECGECHGIFTKGRQDSVAEKELHERLPETPIEDCVLVCEDCYKQIMHNLYGQNAE